MYNNSFTRSRNRRLYIAFGKTLAYLTGMFLFVVCLCGHAQAADAMRDGGRGFLVVFSATQASQWGEGSTYFLHTGYEVYDASGKAVKWVANHGDSADEAPETVELARGAYTVWAQSERGGYVRRTVVVRASVMTTLNLEGAAAKQKSLAME